MINYDLIYKVSDLLEADGNLNIAAQLRDLIQENQALKQQLEKPKKIRVKKPNLEEIWNEEIYSQR
jgi:hypothetical protein